MCRFPVGGRPNRAAGHGSRSPHQAPAPSPDCVRATARDADAFLDGRENRSPPRSCQYVSTDRAFRRSAKPGRRSPHQAPTPPPTVCAQGHAMPRLFSTVAKIGRRPPAPKREHRSIELRSAIGRCQRPPDVPGSRSQPLSLGLGRRAGPAAGLTVGIKWVHGHST